MKGWGTDQIDKDMEQANTMIGKGILQAENFTWEKCAAETIDVYKRVLGH